MKRDVKVIKGDTTLKRTASGCVERSIKRVAAYCRVSTDTEDQINSYNSQVEHYTDFIKQNNEWTLAGIYADEAITGTQVDRRIDFQRLINDCMNGDIDMVITKSISRFARNTLDTLKYVRKLKEYNVAVFFEEENINTLTMDGELLLTILSSVAQQEVENISANVKKGLRMKMERGEMVGFQGCLGYDYDPETKSISVNEKEAEIVRYIFRRYLEGVGGMVISRELEEQGYLSPRGHKRWTETTVLGIIKNEKYKGDLLMGKTFTVDPISKRRLDNFGEQDKFYIENHHEPIISEEDFEKAQGIRLRRAKNRNTVANNGGKREKYSRKYAFSSMLECGFCGHMLSRRNWHSSSEYTKVIWQCVNATKNGKKYCPHSKGIEEEAIEKAFMESYRQVCHNNVEITNEFLKTVEEELKDNSLAKDLKKISNQLDKILKKEKDLVELRLNEAISMEIYQEKYNEIAISKEKLLEEKRTLEVTLTDEKALKKRLEGFKKLLESNKYLEEFDRTVFESIVDKIVIGGTNDDGDIDPAMITIIYKTGKKDSQNGRLFKSRRKNAKVVEENDGDKLYSQSSNEVNKLCSYSTDNTSSLWKKVDEYIVGNYEVDEIKKIERLIESNCKDEAIMYMSELCSDIEDERVQNRCCNACNYIINNWEGIVNRYTLDIPGSCTEGQVSHVLSERFSRNPMGWSKEILGKLSVLRVHKKNGNKIDSSIYSNTGNEQYRDCVNKTNEKLNWSIFDKEKFIFDDSSATRILIKGIGSNRSNILGS